MKENIVFTDEMKEVIRLISETNEHVFITGKAGTGKTTLLKHIVNHLGGKKCVVTAPTGVAAVNAGGVTLHSMFWLPTAPYKVGAEVTMNFRDYKLKMIQAIEVLIIDEISMVRPDVLDCLDAKLKLARHSQLPFGGVQLVMFGDLFQLPPVIKNDEAEILSKDYRALFFFGAHAFKAKGFNVVNLTQIFRQSDPEFIGLLNNIRTYNIMPEDIELLRERRVRNIGENHDEMAIHVCTHRKIVDTINAKMLGDPEVEFEAEISGNFPPSAAPCSQILKLRVGARVMILINNNEQGYCNGTLGNIVAIDDSFLEIETEDGSYVKLEKYTWENCEYKLSGGEIVKEVKGTCTQFPVILAWAITVHKSQGLTFNKVVLHIEDAFVSGQLYVALSRCRSLEGVQMDAFVTRKHVIPNNALLKFEKQCIEDNNYYQIS